MPISRVVSAKPHAAGLLLRVIGSTDPRGAGVAHDLPDVGPFVYFDDAVEVVGPDLPPFGMHPHAGLAVVSFAPRGAAWRADSNVPGTEEALVHPGEAFLTCAGRGIVHDERTGTPGRHELFQVAVRLPRSHRHVPAFLRRCRGTVSTEALQVIVAPSDFEGTGVDAALSFGELAPDLRTRIPDFPSHTVGFVYVRAGSATVGDAEVRAGEVAVCDHLAELHILSGESGAEVLVGTGAQPAGAWAKVLGHNGFVIASDMAAADAKLAEYAERGWKFGQ